VNLSACLRATMPDRYSPVNYLNGSVKKMLRRSLPWGNYFSFGRRKGPSNPLALRTVPYTNICPAPSDPKEFKIVRRDELRHKCKHCAYGWRFDRAAIRCMADATHNQVEIGLHHTWQWENQQPLNWYEQLTQSYWPQMGVSMSQEKRGSKHNRERRGANCDTRNRTRQTWRAGIAWKVAGVGSKGKVWKTVFPYPT
jgi:hypothetical protein